MNEQLAIYLWAISEQLKIILSLIGGGGIISLITYICCAVEAETNKYSRNENLKVMQLIKKYIFLIIFGIIALMLPSKQDLALIFTYPTIKSGVTSAINSKQMLQINKVSTLYLDKVIKDLEKGKN